MDRAARRAPTDDLDCARPAFDSSRFSFFVVEPQPHVAEALADPAPDRGLRSSSTSTRPPGRTMRTASASAAAGCAAWCSACDSSATSTLASLQRQLLELAALPFDVRQPATPGARHARARAPPPIDRWRSTRLANRLASIAR